MKKALTLAIKIGVSLALYVYILNKVDVAKLWQKTRTADPAYVLVAIFIYLLVQIASAYRWYCLLTPLGIKVPFSKIVGLYFLGMFSSLFLPATIGGDVVKIYYLNKEAGSLTGATTSVFLDRDIGLGALLAIAVIAAAFGGTSFNGVPLAPVFGLVIVGFALANLALFYRPTYTVLHKALKLFKLNKSDDKVERLFRSFNTYRGHAGVIAIAMALSVVIQIGGIAVNVAAGAGIGLHTDRGVIDYLVFIPAISLISMIPVSINGMGWREAAYIILFTSAGGDKSATATLALLWLVVLVVTSLPGGLIYVFQGMNKKKDTGAPAADAGAHIDSDTKLRGRIGVPEPEDLESEII
jgi:uncharacterized protein (TIRG00374 family)